MRAYIAIWIPVVLWFWGVPLPLHAEVYSETQEFTEEFSGGQSFYLETLSGSVKIQGVAGNVVRVIAVKKAEGSEEKAGKALKEMKIEVKRSGEQLDVITKLPGEEGFLSRVFGDDRGHRDVWVDFEVTIPSRLHVTVDATSAGVDVRNVGGDVTLDLTSGDVTGQGLGGDVVVDGTSGRVELRQVAGDLLIDNTSGEVVVEGCKGSVGVDKTSGDVWLRGIGKDVEVDGTSCDVRGEEIEGYVALNLISGNAELKGLGQGISLDAVSGDIRASFRSAPKRECQISSISGDVSLYVPEAADLNLDLESVSGQLSVEGLQVREVSKSALRAITGSGRIPVSIETVSGDIEVRHEGK